MKLYRATIMDTPGEQVVGAAELRVNSDGGLLVHDGVIVARDPFAVLAAEHPDAEVVDLRPGVLIPGLVDTHVHYPQIRIIGGLGMPLLDWLDRCALPEEARLTDRAYADGVAADFLGALVRSGTTSALVFGSHFATAVDALFTAADPAGLRITAGQVHSDRILRQDLLTDAETAFAEGSALIERWHGRGLLRYAATPRFSLSASEPILEVSRALMAAADGVRFTSHINENTAEVAEVARLFPRSRDYLDSYDRHGLVTERSVFAHNVHPTDAELARLAGAGAWVAHCPTSNAALGSGLFPLRRHLAAGARVAMGTDIGAGTGLNLLKEGLQAYFLQQLLGPEGVLLRPADLLYLCTLAGASALGLADRVGELSVGKEFDAVWLRPRSGSTLSLVLHHAADDSDALAKIFALGGPGDVAGVWVAGRELHGLPA